MFGIGTWELVVILILALLLLGPDKLPSVARSIGKSLSKLRQTADEVKREIDLDGIKREISEGLLEDPELAEIQRDLDLRSDIRRAMANLQDPPPLPGAEDDRPDQAEPASTAPDDPPRRDGPRTDLEEGGPGRGPGDGLAG